MRWGQHQGGKHLTTTGMVGTSGRLLAFVSFQFLLLYILDLCLLLGQLFSKCFKDATVMKEKHQKAFEAFSSTFPLSTVTKWITMVKNWENDRSQPNPYEEPIIRKFIIIYIYNKLAYILQEQLYKIYVLSLSKKRQLRQLRELYPLILQV